MINFECLCMWTEQIGETDTHEILNHKQSLATGIWKKINTFSSGPFEHIFLMGFLPFFPSEIPPVISHGAKAPHATNQGSGAAKRQQIPGETWESPSNPGGWKVVHQHEIIVILWSPQFIQHEEQRLPGGRRMEGVMGLLTPFKCLLCIPHFTGTLLWWGCTGGNVNMKDKAMI